MELRKVVKYSWIATLICLGLMGITFWSFLFLEIPLLLYVNWLFQTLAYLGIAISIVLSIVLWIKKK